jgi:hypothetical protein
LGLERVKAGDGRAIICFQSPTDFRTEVITEFEVGGKLDALTDARRAMEGAINAGVE